MLQYEIKITRTLTQCEEPGTTVPHLRFTAKVEATSHYVPGETFSLDFRNLAGFTKISSTTLETYEGGTLHTVNASAEDRTAQILQATVRTAVGIAALASGIPPIPATVAGGQPGERQMLVCTQEAKDKLAAVASSTADLKNATANLDRLTERITLLADQARLNSISDAGRQELTGPGGLLEQQRDAARTVATDQTKLDRAQAAVSSVVQIRWPRQVSDRLEVVPLDSASLDRIGQLLTRANLVAGDNGRENECGTSNDAAGTTVQRCLQAKLAIGLTLAPLATGPATTPLEDSDPTVIDPANGGRGIFIRPPERGMLIACQLGSAGACAEGGNDILLRTDDSAVPQLGQLRFLRFENQAFQNNALSLSLRTDGSIEKFEYRETSARGETLANAAANTVGQIQSLAQGLRAGRTAAEAEAAARVTAERNASLASLQFQIDQLTRQDQLDRLSHPSDTSQLTAVQAETAQVSARVSFLQAELAERNAEAALAAAPH